MLHSVVLHRKGIINDTEALHGKKSVPPNVKMEWKHTFSIFAFFFFWKI